MRSVFSLDKKPTNKAKTLQEKLLQGEVNLFEPESHLSAGGATLQMWLHIGAKRVPHGQEVFLMEIPGKSYSHELLPRGCGGWAEGRCLKEGKPNRGSWGKMADQEKRRGEQEHLKRWKLQAGPMNEVREGEDSCADELTEYWHGGGIFALSRREQPERS